MQRRPSHGCKGRRKRQVRGWRSEPEALQAAPDGLDLVVGDEGVGLDLVGVLGDLVLDVLGDGVGVLAEGDAWIPVRAMIRATPTA